MRPVLSSVMRRCLVALGLIGLSAVSGQAQEALYGPQPPKGSAYVRIVNGLDAPVDVAPEFRTALHLGTADGDRVSTYEVVEAVAGKPLKLSFKVAGKSIAASVSAEADGFLTVLLVSDSSAGAKAVGVNDLAQFNQNRARLSFYNAVVDCNDGVLAIENGGQAVFKDVEQVASRARAVNPVTARVVAGCNGKTASPVELSGLEAGGMVSVFLVGGSDKLADFVVHDVVVPYHH